MEQNRLGWVGLGLRQPHYRAFCQAAELAPTAHHAPTPGASGNTEFTFPPAALAGVDFLEVHSENFFAPGGAARTVLDTVRQRWPVSLHGVGLGLGNARGLSAAHLAKLQALVAAVNPALVSEHVCWTADAHAAYNDLLPLPYTRSALDTLCTHIDQVQAVLKRPILIENATAYVKFADDEFAEMDFIAAAVRRTGCGVLLDVNNLYINSVHFGFDAAAVLSALPAGAVRQFHVAGHLDTEDGLVDDHGSRARPAVWALYARALERFGAQPTLIEWDTDVPPLAVLLDEIRIAREVQAQIIDLPEPADAL